MKESNLEQRELKRRMKTRRSFRMKKMKKSKEKFDKDKDQKYKKKKCELKKERKKMKIESPLHPGITFSLKKNEKEKEIIWAGRKTRRWNHGKSDGQY